MSLTQDLITSAEAEWLQRWTAGPREDEGNPLPPGTPAPDLTLLDHTGRQRRLAEFWAEGPALLMFWRHFGCWCGFERAARLRTEFSQYLDAGLTPVIIGQGEPARAAAYRAEYEVPCPMLCDPEHTAYRAYGVGQWQLERILPDAPVEYWAHAAELGKAFQDERRALGKPIVDDPWRAVKEFVVGRNGLVRLTYAYQHCENYPNPAVLIAAARVS
jgi:peroxiredoxin